MNFIYLFSYLRSFQVNGLCEKIAVGNFILFCFEGVTNVASFLLETTLRPIFQNENILIFGLTKNGIFYNYSRTFSSRLLVYCEFRKKIENETTCCTSLVARMSFLLYIRLCVISLFRTRVVPQLILR